MIFCAGPPSVESRRSKVVPKIDSLKVKVNLQSKDVEFIKKIMALCPELFKNIDTGLKGILADNVID